VQHAAMTFPLAARVLGNYPFNELHARGWVLENMSEPFARLPGRDPVRTAYFSWGHAGFTFDVDENGHMSEFATYVRDEDISLIADTPQAVASLVASSPRASLEELCAIPDVIDFHRRHES
jgi:hypothetical protein